MGATTTSSFIALFDLTRRVYLRTEELTAAAYLRSKSRKDFEIARDLLIQLTLLELLLTQLGHGEGPQTDSDQSCIQALSSADHVQTYQEFLESIRSKYQGLALQESKSGENKTLKPQNRNKRITSWPYSSEETQAMVQNAKRYIGIFCQSLPVYQRFKTSRNIDGLAKLPALGETKTWSALEMASFAGDVDSMRVLLERSTDISTDLANSAALYYAIRASSEGCVQLLLENKADISDTISEDKSYPLHVAAVAGDEKVFRMLLNAGADPNSQNGQARTPLLEACSHGSISIVKMLLGIEGVDVNWNHSKDGRTPLYAATENGHEEIVRVLIGAKSINLEFKTSEGCAALLCAVKKEFVAITQLLLDAGADPDTADGRLCTALMWASDCGYETIVKMLLDTKKVNINAVAVDGDTPLHCTVAKEKIKIMEALLSCPGIDLNIKNCNGLTPLDMAIRLRSKHSAKILEGSGAKPSHKLDKIKQKITKFSGVFSRGTHVDNSAQSSTRQDNCESTDTSMPSSILPITGTLTVLPLQGKADSISINPERLPQYSYSPLPPYESIRLLRITPQKITLPDGSTQNVCTLETYKLSTCPNYIALSYTWGSPINDPDYIAEYRIPERWILLSNGQYFQIEVGRNLFKVLCRLPSLPYSISLVWIDALCICQSNLKERASQVKLMGDIYTRCSKVLVWLGEPRVMNSDMAAFSILHKTVVPALEGYIAANGIESIATMDWDESNFYTRLGLNFARPRAGDADWAVLGSWGGRPLLDWEAYYQFYQERNWLKRSWVYQEISFAPSVSVCCGNFAFTFDVLVFMAFFLRISGLTGAFFTEFTGNTPTVKYWFTHMEICANLRKKCEGIGSAEWTQNWMQFLGLPNDSCISYEFFFSCLRELRRVEATDPRDKIFAALGYLKKSLPSNIRPKLEPNYEISVEDVYIMAATVLLEELPDLSLLSEVEDPSLRLLDNLPSWVPDFSVQTVESILGTNTKPGLYNAFLCKRENALDSKYARINGRKLTLQGVILDTVENVQSGLPDTHNLHEVEAAERYLKQTTTSWLQLLTKMTKWEYKETMLEVLWRTLVTNKMEQEGAPTLSNETFHDYFLDYVVNFLFPEVGNDIQPLAEEIAQGPCCPSEETLEGYCSNEEFVKTLYPGEEILGKRSKVQANVFLFGNACNRHTVNRLLFTTSVGRLGLGPLSVQRGDQVWLIAGARMPFILRPSGQEGSFTLIGEVYVHDYMNGKIIDKISKWVEDVTLC